MTPDEAAIERMARALCTDAGVNPDRISPIALAPNWMLWRQAANAAFTALLADPPPAVERAVLERLREATPAMCKAGDEWQTETDGPYAGEGVSMSAESVWRVMIDARLAELAQGESDGGH